MAGFPGDFGAYLWRLAPGLTVFLALLAVLPRRALFPRLVVYILSFVLFRDTMTPFRYWSFSPEGAIRFAESPGLLFLLAGMSVGFIGMIQGLEPEMRELVKWRLGSALEVFWGLAGALVIAAPVWAFQHVMGFTSPAVSARVLPALLTLCLLGNLLEEYLFRGILQGWLETLTTPTRAALGSGLFFAAFHASLAIAVTAVGLPIVFFVVWEGLLCAFLRRRGGVLPAALAHGGALFLLTAGILG